jgi:magnesium-transporting ATPase (P-type)
MAVDGVSSYNNIVFAGTTIASGVAKGVVVSTGKDTEFGRIVSIARGIKDPLSPLQEEINHTAKLDFTVAIAVASIFFVITSVFLRLTTVESMLFSIGVMTCLVPEGFQVTVSLALAFGALAMSREKVVVKRLSSVETLGSTTVICVDKTGTITSGEMFVKKVWASGHVFEVTGEGYRPQGFVTINGRRINAFERPHILRLFEASAFSNNAQMVPPSDRIPKWTVLGDTTDAALMVFSRKGDFNLRLALAESPRILLIPLDARRKMMTSVHKNANGGITVYTKGAPLGVLSRCTQIFFDNSIIDLDVKMRATIEQQINQFASEAFRVLALAMKVLSSEPEDLSSEGLESDLTFLGLAAIYDPPRPNVEKAVEKAWSAGIRVIMVTGDHELTAEAIAKKVGILTTSEHTIVSGSDLERLSDEELSNVLDAREIVFARTAPEQKLRIVRALKSKGEIVTVTGDGVNDAPALLDAHVGISMGLTGTDVARESSDMVLLDDNFVSIVKAIELGRSVFDNLKRFVYYVFVHNMAELMTFISFVLFNIPLPLLVSQVLAIDLGMDLLPSLAITLEPPKPHVMLKPPRPPGTRLIDFKTLFRSSYVGLLMALWAMFGAFNIWSQAGWVFGQNHVSDPVLYAKGTTMVMAGIIAGQLGTFLAARTNLEPAYKLSPLRNKWILIGIFSSFAIMMTIVYVPFFNTIFGTSPLSLSDWIYLYSLAPVIFMLEDVRKAILRHKNKT